MYQHHKQTVDAFEITIGTNNVDWGCPMNGEDVYVIKGVNNPQFTEPDKYKDAVTKLIEKLATAFEQTTVTTTWSKVNMVYTTKKDWKEPGAKILKIPKILQPRLQT